MCPFVDGRLADMRVFARSQAAGRQVARVGNGTKAMAPSTTRPCGSDVTQSGTESGKTQGDVPGQCRSCYQIDILDPYGK